ncbi:hypothetical protein [Mycobacteroides abscessus]|nr:hypothetical protein [Mycobacteroides abscessus]
MAALRGKIALVTGAGQGTGREAFAESARAMNMLAVPWVWAVDAGSTQR